MLGLVDTPVRTTFAIHSEIEEFKITTLRVRTWAWAPEFLFRRPLPSPAYDPFRAIGEENRTPSVPFRSLAAYITSTISLPPLRDRIFADYSGSLWSLIPGEPLAESAT